MNRQHFNTKLYIWRKKYIREKNFALIVSGVIGMLTGLAAIFLKEMIHFISTGLALTQPNIGYFYYFFPLVGLLITVLLANYVLKTQLGHGITHILFVISKKSSFIARVKMYSHLFYSAITVGFGGSVGIEAPIVVSGAAFGSNIGRYLHLNYKIRTLLIGCGAAGAISAIFNAPIGAVIFCVEVLLVEVTITAFIPLLIASLAGYLMSLSFSRDETLLSIQLTEGFALSDIPFYMILGILCGLVSVYFIRIVSFSEQQLLKIDDQLSRVAIGGLILSFFIFVFPPLFGEGYEFVERVLEGTNPALINPIFGSFDSVSILIVIAFLVLIKPIATAMTLGAGGAGGVFAPSLLVGGFTGFGFAKLLDLLQIKSISENNFALVGMCGVMSGVQHAPLTAIFLIAEITGGHMLFVPLMLVSVIAYMTHSYFEKHSIYTRKLIEKGDLIPHDKDQQVLSLIQLQKLIERDLLITSPADTLGDLVKLIRKSKRNIFPVIDDQKQLVGIVTLDDVRELMFDLEKQEKLHVSDLMSLPPAQVSLSDSMHAVMNKFQKTGAWNLPVTKDGKYIGFVSKSRIFNAYRNKIMQ